MVSHMTGYTGWSTTDSAALIAVPGADDDKYSRGVLGIMTGSIEYPGAAVLGVEAALRTGVGMVRYLGDASQLVLQRRPEAVTAVGRVQAWLLGSGIDARTRTQRTTDRMLSALADGVPAVIDSGALDLVGQASGHVVITPHYRELATLLGCEVDDVAAAPGQWCSRAADELGVTVLLKGSRTHVAGVEGRRLITATATGWLATAGTGDALGGVVGALLASHARGIERNPEQIAELAATAAVVHAHAGLLASNGGPFTVLDLCAALPATVAELVRGHP